MGLRINILGSWGERSFFFQGAGSKDPPPMGRPHFLRVFTIYGHGHETKISQTKFQFHFPRRLLIKFQPDRSSGFREEDL